MTSVNPCTLKHKIKSENGSLRMKALQSFVKKRHCRVILPSDGIPMNISGDK